MEHAALKGEDSIASMDYCVLDTDWMETAIANSYGLSLYHVKNSVTAYVCAIAKDGKKSRPALTSGKETTGNSLTLWQQAERRRRLPQAIWARYPLPAENIKWCWMVLLWQTFWGILWGILCGKHPEGIFHAGRKSGEQIAADCVTLRDDPLLPEGTPLRLLTAKGYLVTTRLLWNMVC